MKLKPFCSTFILFLLVVLATPRLADAQTRAIGYELIIGEKLHEVALGVPFSIVTPAGEKLTAVLRQKATLAFADYGLSFDYPREMTLSSETTSPVPTIYLEMAQSPFAMIQVYSAPNTVESILKILKDSFENEFKSRKAEFFQGSGKGGEPPDRRLRARGGSPQLSDWWTKNDHRGVYL